MKSFEIEGGDFRYEIDLGIPSESAQKKALQELRETPQNMENGLKELKRLLQAETNLNVPLDNEEWLIKFLRPCKFYPESARDLIKRCYNLRRKYSELTKLLIPSKLQQVFDNNLTYILPKCDQHGRNIIVALHGKQWNHREIHIDEMHACNVLCSEVLQLEPESQINGIVYIIDLKGLSFAQALQITPYRVKRTLDYLHNNTPTRVKGSHIVNQPAIFQPIFSAAKPFFNAKSANRIFMHGTNYESLHQHISPECLPACYGGTMNSKFMFGRESYELATKYEKLFEEFHTYGFKTD